MLVMMNDDVDDDDSPVETLMKVKVTLAVE